MVRGPFCQNERIDLCILGESYDVCLCWTYRIAWLPTVIAYGKVLVLRCQTSHDFCRKRDKSYSKTRMSSDPLFSTDTQEEQGCYQKVDQGLPALQDT